MKIGLGSVAAAVAGLLLVANVASAQQGPPSKPSVIVPATKAALPVVVRAKNKAAQGVKAAAKNKATQHVSVPEIDAMSGLAAFAAVCGALTLAWERRQKM